MINNIVGLIVSFYVFNSAFITNKTNYFYGSFGLCFIMLHSHSLFKKI